jgi:excisionase family DNA binding protein
MGHSIENLARDLFYHPNMEDYTTMEQTDELLTVREVARRLRVDDTTVRRWIKHGTLEAVSLPHVGKRQAYRVRRSTIDTLLNQPALPS